MNIDLITKTLQAGGIIVAPTDTVYGVCAVASNKDAVQKLYKLKNRSKKPGTLIASSIDQLVALGIKRQYLKPVEYLWPSSVSVIIPTGFDLKYLDQGVGSLAMRVIDDNSLKLVLEKNGALLSTSANPPGQTPATTINEAKNYFGEAIDLYVDGGDLSSREPSTIIRVIDDAIEIVRPGAVKINEKGEMINGF